MFLCRTCHNEDTCPRGFVESLSGSYGRCEGCGNVAACVDCQGYKLDLPITDERPEHRPQWKCRTCNQLLNVTVDENDLPIKYTHAKELDHAADPIPVIESDTPATLVCDFCSQVNPTWHYPCLMLNQAGPGGEVVTGEMVAFKPDGTTQVVSFREDDPDFLACQECHELIEAGDPVKLAIRSIERYMDGRKVDHYEAHLITLVTEVHSRFWQTRNGPAQSVSVPQEDT